MVEDIKPIKSSDIDKYQKALVRQKTVEMGKKELSARDVVNYLLYVGLDYKGQIQMASEALGYGGGAEVSINPLGLVGLNTEVGLGDSIKAAKQRTVVVWRGPSNVTMNGVPQRVPEPIVVNSIIGQYWENKAQLSIDVSVGFEASVGVGPTSGGTAPATEAKSFLNNQFGNKETEAPAHGYEAVGLVASLKAGFKGEAGYMYDHFYGEDVYPLSFADSDAAKKKLEVILAEGSTKTTIKLEACNFINSNKIHFGNKEINLHPGKLWQRTTGHKEIISRLKTVSPVAPQRVRTEAKDFINKLEFYDREGDKSCFLRLSSHKPEGKAGLYMKGEAKGTTNIPTIGINAGAFAGVLGEFKQARARFQTMVISGKGTHAGTGDKTLPVYTTYDSVVTYSSFALGLTLEFDADWNVVGSGRSLSKNTRVGQAMEKLTDKTTWKPDRLNQIRYACAIAFWARPQAGFAKDLTPGGTPKADRVQALNGTGFAVGLSFSVGNLVKFYENYYNTKTSSWQESSVDATYIKTIAMALGIKNKERGKVLEFLRDPHVYSTIVWFLPLDVSVLIEGTYRPALLPELKATVGLDKEKCEQIQLDKEFSLALKPGSTSPPILESIRLRYRKRDVFEKDGNLFTVGFKVGGTGAKIKLDRVERAGADGIFDVATVFMSEELKRLHESNPAEAYEKAVPPAALFFQ